MITNYIIVGLDDSAASRAAHRWAVEYARATGKDLCAVHVLDWPIGLNASAIKSGTRLYIPKEEVAEPYWRGMHRVFGDTDSPQGSALRFAQGDVGDVLVRLSAQAALLVIGIHESVRRPYLGGSIGHYCISHANCPVVTVPEPVPDSNGLPDHDTRHHASAVAAASRAAAAGYRTYLSPARGVQRDTRFEHPRPAHASPPINSEQTRRMEHERSSDTH